MYRGGVGVLLHVCWYTIYERLHVHLHSYSLIYLCCSVSIGEDTLLFNFVVVFRKSTNTVIVCNCMVYISVLLL